MTFLREIEFAERVPHERVSAALQHDDVWRKGSRGTTDCVAKHLEKGFVAAHVPAMRRALEMNSVWQTCTGPRQVDRSR